MPVSPPDFRRVCGSFATGVTVVTCRVGDRQHGITVNSFASVSLEPPLILICIDHRAQAHQLLQQVGRFGVSVLAAQQRELSDYFAKRLFPDPDDEFALVPHHYGITGAPLIDGALAYLECAVVAAHEAGDHHIYVAEVIEATVCSDDPPLLFHRGRYPKLG
jgi:flavin reductase (DIM6/NTAB) family NADH-FMN oxidoreductase RutF